MIGLDTNVLARYYIEDEGDAEGLRQREAARRLLESGKALMVSKSVLLELEWLMRGYYDFTPVAALKVLRHILGQPHIEVEDREGVSAALAHCEGGLEFADALHHASYRQCKTMASFDDRRFARRAKRLGLTPAVNVPA